MASTAIVMGLPPSPAGGSAGTALPACRLRVLPAAPRRAAWRQASHFPAAGHAPACGFTRRRVHGAALGTALSRGAARLAQIVMIHEPTLGNHEVKARGSQPGLRRYGA